MPSTPFQTVLKSSLEPTNFDAFFPHSNCRNCQAEVSLEFESNVDGSEGRLHLTNSKSKLLVLLKVAIGWHSRCCARCCQRRIVCSKHSQLNCGPTRPQLASSCAMHGSSAYVTYTQRLRFGNKIAHCCRCCCCCCCCRSFALLLRNTNHCKIYMFSWLKW